MLLVCFSEKVQLMLLLPMLLQRECAWFLFLLIAQHKTQFDQSQSGSHIVQHQPAVKGTIQTAEAVAAMIPTGKST